MTSDTKGAFAPLATLLACFAIVVLLGACNPREIPSEKPTPTIRAWVQASGKSMLPTFPEFALVEVEFGVKFESLKAGDTVVFWDYTRGTPTFIHHRLIQQQGGNWIAQGDNAATNPTADRPWVTRENFIGRTTGRHTQLLFTSK